MNLIHLTARGETQAGGTICVQTGRAWVSSNSLVYFLSNMSMKQQLDQDVKRAMLAGDKTLTMTLRGLKSVILYAEVAKGSREEGLADADIIDLFAKEAKKRQESADMYRQGGNEERASAELVEKQVIEQYLPKQLTDDEIGTLIDGVINETGAAGPQVMGQVIGAVKAKAGASADGARIASLVKERLSS